MARLMRMSDDVSGWAGDGPRSNGFGSARRTWASTAWLVAGTLAVAVTSYSLSLKVANERREMERLSRQNVALERDLKALDAELRVRMRMPQLQRWNDSVLGLVPISATQYLDSPVRLAGYGKPLPSELPQVQLAVRDVIAQPQVASQPRLVSAEIPPALTATPPAATSVAAIRPAPDAAAPAIARPLPEDASADLVRQVEMTFGPNDGPQR